MKGLNVNRCGVAVTRPNTHVICQMMTIPSLQGFLKYPIQVLIHTNTSYFFWTTYSNLVSFSPSENLFENHGIPPTQWIQRCANVPFPYHWQEMLPLTGRNLEKDQAYPLLILSDISKTLQEVEQHPTCGKDMNLYLLQAFRINNRWSPLLTGSKEDYTVSCVNTCHRHLVIKITTRFR